MEGWVLVEGVFGKEACGTSAVDNDVDACFGVACEEAQVDEADHDAATDEGEDGHEVVGSEYAVGDGEGGIGVVVDEEVGDYEEG